jgi:chemotaxis protein MotB
MKKYILYFYSVLLIFCSCVTPKIHNTLIAENEVCRSNHEAQQKRSLELTIDLEKLEGNIKSLKSTISKLRNDSLQNGGLLIILQNKYDDLSDSYDLLSSKNSREMANKAKETKELLEQLEKTQSALFNKEDELTRLSLSLNTKQEELALAQEHLDIRSARVTELESIISIKDSIVTLLKQSISKALTGLEGEGLTIEQRNGKVYVSLEEALLFASGRYEVNNGGVIALNKLSIALAMQKDLEILVEGHTDSIPFTGKGLVKDNWDLSVMRATNVVKVLTKNKSFNPIQLTAAGRAEFVPIADNTTLEGRSSNRRIDIILSPNLDELFKILEE